MWIDYHSGSHTGVPAIGRSLNNAAAVPCVAMLAAAGKGQPNRLHDLIRRAAEGPLHDKPVYQKVS